MKAAVLSGPCRDRWQQPRRVVDTLAYVAPDGRVAVIEPLPRWTRFGHATDPATIREALEGAGLTIDAEHDFLSGRSFLIARR